MSTTEINCNGCGLCCQNQPSPPFTCDEDEDWKSLPQELKDEIDTYVMSPRYNDTHPCFWLDGNGRCRHYEHRPEICRDYELGGEACLAEREHLIQIDPGPQRGPSTVSQINAQVKQASRELPT